MAPELLQWNRNESTKTIGSAADIFSLGATVFELAANVQMPKGVLTLTAKLHPSSPPRELSFTLACVVVGGGDRPRGD